MAKGQRGVTFSSRKLSGDVRDLGLLQIKRILEGIDKKFVSEENINLPYRGLDDLEKQVILKLAPTLLPRLNAGRDDNEQLIPNPLLAYVRSNDSSSKNTGFKQENPGE